MQCFLKGAMMNYGKEQVRKRLRNTRENGRKLTSRMILHILKITFLTAVLALVLAGGFALGTIRGIIDTSPEPEKLNVTPLGIASNIYDSEGNLKETLIQSGSNRDPVAYSQFPQNLINAFISIEDERFWTHEGVDIRGILRSSASLLLSGHINGGASTITQQLIKNNVFDGGMEKGWGARFIRKFQEQYLAMELDREISKEDILSSYLNSINLGQNCLGVQVASQRYFRKDVSELTLSECAALAGIPQNPYRYNPITFPENNAIRRLSVLNHMEEQGYITTEEKEEALADTDALYARIAENNLVIKENAVPYTYFTDAVISAVLRDLQNELGYSESDAFTLLYSGGLNIYTTQNSAFQNILDEEVNRRSNYPDDAFQYTFTYQVNATLADGRTITYTHNTLQRTLNLGNLLFSTKREIQNVIDQFKAEIFGPQDQIADEKITYIVQPQLSAVLIDQRTGHVLAITGGRGEKTASRSLNRATGTYRSPGSTFKPLSTFAPALDVTGMSLATVIEDLPFSYNGTTIRNWWASDLWMGNCNARQALIYSMNVVSARTFLYRVGIETGFSYLEQFGISSLVREKEVGGKVYTDLGPALSVGALTDGANLLDVTAAYAAIAGQGIYREPIFYTRVTDHDGNLLLEKPQEVHRVIKESTAFLLTNALADSMKEGITFKGTYLEPSSLNAYLGDIPAAGKSGTSTDAAGKSRDYWFIGYTAYYTLGIWSGFDDGGISLSGNVTENAYHKDVWREAMTRIHKDLPIQGFVVPDNVTTARICSLSGKLAVPGLCDQDPKCQCYNEFFTADTVPTTGCDIHIMVRMCQDSQCEATPYCSHTYEKMYYRMAVPEVITLDSEYIYRAGTSPSLCPYHTEPPPPPTQPTIYDENGNPVEYDENGNIIPRE